MSPPGSEPDEEMDPDKFKEKQTLRLQFIRRHVTDSHRRTLSGLVLFFI